MPKPKNQMHRGQMGVNRLSIQVATLTSRYVQAEARVTSLVARAVLGGTLGTAKVRRALRRDVRVMMVELDNAAIPEAEKIIEHAYDLGRRLADSQSTGRIDETALKLLQDGLTRDLTNATVSVGRRVDDIFRKAALTVLSASEEDGPSALETKLGQHGIGSFKDISGRTWSLGDYARMAVKTTQAEATFTATHLTLQREGLDLVDINSVANPCPRCVAINGGTFSLSGASSDYPLLPTVLPVHPECQHYAVVSTHNFVPVPA